MIFQRRTKKCDYVFHIGSEIIDYTNLTWGLASHLPEILPFCLNTLDKKLSIISLV